MLKYEFIKNLELDLSREYNHLHFYLLASVKVKGVHRKHLNPFFEKAAEGELKHVLAWSKMIVGLKGNPHVTTKISIEDYTPKFLLERALQMEEEVVGNFIKRIEEAQELQKNGGQDKIDGIYTELFLENQILDSRADADELYEMVTDFNDFK